jgi:hypothetical protein
MSEDLISGHRLIGLVLQKRKPFRCKRSSHRLFYLQRQAQPAAARFQKTEKAANREIGCPFVLAAKRQPIQGNGWIGKQNLSGTPG